MNLNTTLSLSAAQLSFFNIICVYVIFAVDHEDFAIKIGCQLEMLLNADAE